jgi:hypothetical protein
MRHITVILLAISLLMNIGLTWKVKSVHKSLESLTQKFLDSNFHPSVGALVNYLKVTDIDGKPVTLNMKAPEFKYTVLYIFSPRCGWCKRNLSNLKSLAAQTGPQFRLVGLSTTNEGIGVYAREQGFNFPVYVLPEGMVPETLVVAGTPTTFVISNGSVGSVVASWTGAYNKEYKSEIEGILKVRFPD